MHINHYNRFTRGIVKGVCSRFRSWDVTLHLILTLMYSISVYERDRNRLYVLELYTRDTRGYDSLRRVIDLPSRPVYWGEELAPRLS